MKYFGIYTFIISIAFLISTSCSKGDIPISTETKKHEIFIYNGMLSFESYDHLNAELLMFSELSNQEKEKWLNKYSIATYGSIFRKVIEKEDSISEYMFSLTKEEQETYLNQPQIHSDIYNHSMKMGIIKNVYEDDNTYFDVNLVDNTYSDFINLDGKIRIGNDILSINDCEKSLYLDINYETDIPEKARFIKLPIIDKEKIYLKSQDPHNWSEVKAAILYDRNWLGRNQKKVWAEIEGQSYLSKWLEGMTDYCSNTMHTDFVLKAYAQKRNFWGNFVFSGNFSPKVEMTGTWSYDFYYWNEQHSSWNDFKCGWYDYQKTRGTLLPNYHCYPIPNIYCRRSPLNISDYGNSWKMTVAPHGVLGSSIVTGQDGLWWAQAIRMLSMNITIKIDGYPFYFTK